MRERIVSRWCPSRGSPPTAYTATSHATARQQAAGSTGAIREPETTPAGGRRARSDGWADGQCQTRRRGPVGCHSAATAADTGRIPAGGTVRSGPAAQLQGQTPGADCFLRYGQLQTDRPKTTKHGDLRERPCCATLQIVPDRDTDSASFDGRFYTTNPIGGSPSEPHGQSNVDHRNAATW